MLTTSDVLICSNFQNLGVDLEMFTCYNVQETHWLSYTLHCCSTSIHPPSNRTVSLWSPSQKRPSLLHLVRSHRPEQAQPTLFLHQLHQLFNHSRTGGEVGCCDSIAVTLQRHGGPDRHGVNTGCVHFQYV